MWIENVKEAIAQKRFDDVEWNLAMPRFRELPFGDFGEMVEYLRG